MTHKTRSSCNAIRPMFVDALFGDIESDALEVLNGHLASCEACARAFQEMQGTLQLTKQVVQEDPPEAYWAEFQQRLHRRIATETASREASRGAGLVHRIRALLVPPPAWAYQTGLAVVLVLIGIMIGRYGRTDVGTDPVIAENTVDAAYLEAAERQRYLDRSSVLLMGLVNFDAETDGTTVLNLDHKREIAGSLVQDAALIKASLDANEDAQLRMLIEELEKILLQIANLEAQQDLPGIEMIQSGIEGRALLLKINLETMKLKDQAITKEHRAPAYEL